ncbi:hypothetical protein [uncultured Devosia sp.]|uniref:hypothetical protein n=1 Tax=uncultured Devosia sp. TaxID=211434 RepID=UPI0035CB3F6D
MGNWPIVLALIAGSIIIAGAVIARPSDFRQCIEVISSDIERANATATLDPRDVEAQAAKICAGHEGN